MGNNKPVVTAMYFCDEGECNDTIRLKLGDSLASHGWKRDSLFGEQWILCPKHNPDNRDAMPSGVLNFSQDKKSLKEFASDLGLDPNETPGKRVIKRK